MSKPIILIVDDEREIADDIAETMLETGKYEVLKAYSGSEAVSVVESRNKGLLKKDDKKIKLVMMDIRMPGMDGIQALEKISEIDEKVGVIMVSAYGTEDNWMKSIVGSEAMAFVTKPYDNDKLLQIVNDFFAGGKDNVSEKFRRYFWQKPIIDELRKTEERIRDLGSLNG